MPDAPTPTPTAEPSERFITLLNSTHGRLLGFLRVILGNNADAEDVLQRASLTIWRKFAEFDPTKDFFAWASSFAFYEAKNFQRVAARSRLHFDDELMKRIADERVLDAMRRHTVAAPHMTRLDAIVYLADGLEPGRQFPEREALESLAFRDLDAAMRALLESSLAYLGARGLEAAPQTLAALEYYQMTERTPLSA